MRDRVETRKLLKLINKELADIQKREEELATLRLSLSNASKLFLIDPVSVTNTRLIAFRQSLGRLANSYLDQETKVYDIMQVFDTIQP